MKNLFFGLAAFIGEILIAAIAVEFLPLLGPKISVLNFVVLSICFLILLSPVYSTIVGKNGYADSWVGALGIRISACYFYLIFTVLVVIACNVMTPPVPFRYQLYLHLFILVIFCAYIGFSYAAADKVEQVYYDEQRKTVGVDDMKRAARSMQDAASMCSDLPANFRSEIDGIADSARFISPNISAEASEYEQEFISAANDITYFLNAGFNNRADELSRYLKRINITLQNRKRLLQ